MKHLVAMIVMLLASLCQIDSAGAQAGPDCVLQNSTFAELTRDFSRNWSESSDLCQFKRLTELNKLITRDMRMNSKRYMERLQVLYSYQDRDPAVNYLLLSFQESWFNLFFNSVLSSEFDRASTRTRWALTGGAAAALLLLVLPRMGKYSTKLVRFMRTGVRNLFQKRAIVFSGTSLLQQKKLLGIDGEEVTKVKFVPPPIINAAAPEVFDERADGVFLRELNEDIISASGGIAGGIAAGYVPSLIVKSYAPNWTTFFKGAWSRTWLARFASPGMIAGTAITFVASDWISDELAAYQLAGRMAATQNDLVVDAAKVTDAVKAGNEMEIWRLGEYLRGDWALQRYMLSRELNQELEDIVNGSIGDLKAFRCLESKADLRRDQRTPFGSAVKSAIEKHKLQLGISVQISGAILHQLLLQPHAMTESLMALMNESMMSDKARLDIKMTSDVLWEGVESYLKSLPEDCAAQQAIP